MSAVPPTDQPLAIAEDVRSRTEADEVRVVAAHRRAGLTRFAESHIHQHVGEDATTVSVTVVRDGRVASASTTDTTADGLTRLVARATEAADAAPVDTRWPGVSGPAELSVPDRVGTSTVAATGEDRARVVRDFIDAGGANAAGYCDSETTTLALVDSAGAAMTSRTTRATLDGIHRLPGDQAGSGHQSSHDLADLDGALAGAQARHLADLGTVEVDLDPGRVPVVLGPEAASTLMIFLSFYGFNGKSHAEGQSGIRVAEPQFDPSFSLADRPGSAQAIAGAFDAEGTPRHDLELVRAGTSAGLSHDRRTAAAAGTTSTGHGSPGSSMWGPVAANLVVEPGTETRPVASLADGMERGLVITAFNYCRVLDPKAITVTGLTRNGTFLVEDGRLVGSVGNVRFTQSFLDAVGPDGVVAYGDDGRLADGEFGPAMVHTPSLRLASWNITGTLRG